MRQKVLVTDALCNKMRSCTRLLTSGFSMISNMNIRAAVKEVETIVPCAPLDKRTLIGTPHDALPGG